MRYSIGLTGAMGGGKSTVLSFFKDLGVPVFSADTIARSLTEKDSPSLKSIHERFGDIILNPDGTLNRKNLRSIITRHNEERIWLESLLHPLIRDAIFEAAKNAPPPYCMIEIPLLTKKDDYPYIQRILTVECDSDIQMERILTRDKVSQEEALSLINKQLLPKKRLLLADDVIHNNGSLEDLKKNVLTLHEKYLRLIEY